jgi:hypothetical protein
MWKVLVTVSGGVTGTRSAYLKAGGYEVEFDNKAEAECRAADYMKAMNTEYSTARFTAKVVEEP